MALRNFDPDALLKDWSDEKYNPLHNGKTFEECIRLAFNIPKSDNYIYRAQGETTLAITQRAIGAKRTHGMHNWYHDENGQPNDPPHPSPDEIPPTPPSSPPPSPPQNTSTASNQTPNPTPSAHP
ncbi:hypothetical protein GRF29_185g1402270 [Pseudopithomyces chartarum]|uniref:Uncharacterized protein n=1 Tax=Pseudopithomyces chartarum TaxID=1892770 RepID=A0AAN6LPE4_9PLEO|nr:hypothetical protein GRF29_185g1402270 [Pseudopithomyces chartarum]